MDEISVVRVVADEFGDHPPIWFPAPIFDDVSQMPVSSSIIEQLRSWNNVGQDRTQVASAAEISEHYRVGMRLAQMLANELGAHYAVEMLVAGDADVAGWRRIYPSTA